MVLFVHSGLLQASTAGTNPVKIVHYITRLIVGGAQENTLLTVLGQQRDFGDEVVLLTGPGLGPEGSLIERARALGANVQEIPALRRNIHPWRDWLSYRATVRAFRRLNPDIVHTHSSKAGILGRLAASRVGVPAVHTIHGAAFHANQSLFARRLFRFAERFVANRTARWISVCNAMTDQYVQAGVDEPGKFITIYSGMDVEPFLEPVIRPGEMRARFGLHEDDVVVAKVARLFHLKGHHDLIDAAGRLAAKHPRLHYLLIGDGILRSDLEGRIQKAGLTDRFHFSGLVPPEDVPDLIHAADFVVHTSRREGLARVLPQALIAGKPVVSYDIDGAREVVRNGQTGFLVPAGDLAGLTDAIGQLASEPELRRQLGVNGRERFTDQFRHQTMTSRIRSVYEEVISCSNS